MSIRVNLPDGSVANFPDGMDPQAMQDEIERYLAQSQQGQQRQPQTMAQARPPQAEAPQAAKANPLPVEDLIQESDPVRRRPTVSIDEAQAMAAQREAQTQEQQAARGLEQISDQRLESERLAAESGGIKEFATRAAEGFTGAVRNAGASLNEGIGRNLSIMGATDAGARFMETADSTRDLGDRRVADRQAREEARVARVAEIDAEIARRQSPPSGAAPGQPAGELPSVQNPNAGQRTDVSMPREFSATAARPNAAPTFNMADGSTVKLGKAPPAAVKNAVRNGVDYMEQNANQVVFGLLRQGKIQQARDFQSFMAERKTIRGMEETNKSYVALHYKDENLWSESLAGMVDNLYPDGEFEIDTKGTRFMRDDADNVIGGVVSIRNRETGEVFEQEYVGMESLMRGVAEVGMPDAAYEYQKSRVEQAQQQRVANAKSYQEAYDETAKLMFKNGFTDALGKPISPEEQQQYDQMIRGYIASSRPDLPQPPPRQPAAAPPPAASGIGSSIRSFFGGSTGDKPVPTFGG